MTEKTFGVVVTPHAITRFQDHFPDCPPERVVPTIYREVTQALNEHRRTSRVPKWANNNHKQDSRAHPTRYVWDEHQTRCYALLERRPLEDRRDDYTRTWVVKTVLPRMSEDEIHVAQTLKRTRKREKRNKLGLSQRRVRHG